MKTVGGGSEGRLGLNNLLFHEFTFQKYFFTKFFFKGWDYTFTFKNTL